MFCQFSDQLRVGSSSLRFLREKEARTKEIYKKLYGFDLGEDFSPFHLILDVNQLNRDEVFQALRMTIDNLVLTRKETLS